MRSVILIVLSVALALSVATSASATSSITLVPIGDSVGCGTDCYVLQPGETISFAIRINVDTVGLAAYAFDVIWDTDGEDELDLITARHRASLNFLIPSEPPGNVNFANTPITGTLESGVGTGGFVYGFDSTVATLTPPHPATLSFRVGIVAFTATSNVNDTAGTDIQIGFFRPAGGAFGGAGPAFPFITPNFSMVQIRLTTIPEPRTSLLIGASLSTLALLARRRGRRDG